MIEIIHRYTRAVLYKSEDAKAYLSRANLSRANLSRANLLGTVLAPNLPTNKYGEFGEIDGECVGYRTRTSQHCGDNTYADGETYRAETFSVCPLTACHPGLYVYPNQDHVTKSYPGIEAIEVRFRRDDLHAAGGKYRVREFRVIGEARK